MRIFITGGRGFIGRSLAEHLSKSHEVFSPSHGELDLLDSDAVSAYVRGNEPDAVIHAANRGGTRDALNAQKVVEDNLRMFFNVLRGAGEEKKVIYFGSGAEFGKHRDLHKVGEDKFGESVPRDDYGFYKYVCNKQAEKSGNVTNLRLFGVFGKYENYEFRFISNAILKNLFGQPITINQNVVFDYLYIPDLITVVEHFLSPKAKPASYNVTPDSSIDLLTIAKTINEIAEKPSEIRVLNPGLNHEYTGSNARLKGEMPSLGFCPYAKAIGELYSYYSENLGKIDKSRIIADPYLSGCTRRPAG